MAIFFLAMLFAFESCAAVRILTFHYNEPNILEMQYKTLNAFLKDDFELIVFNDARTIENEQGIENVCNQYKIQCVRFQQEWHLSDSLNAHLKACLQDPSTIGAWNWNALTSIETIANNPSVRHSHVIQYALEHYGYDHDDIVVIMDGDNIPIKPFSIREMLGSYDLVGFDQMPDVLGKFRRQNQIHMTPNEERLWIVLVAFHPRKLLNVRELKFHVDVISGQHHFPENQMGDTGSALYRYLQKYPNLKIQSYGWQDSELFRKYFYCQELKDLGFDDDLIQFIHEIYPGNVQFFAFEHFMHFSAISAQDREHDRKMHYLQKIIQKILNKNS